MIRKGFSLPKIRKHIEEYKKFITSDEYDEIYKWKALNTFQKNWDLEAKDFKKMYENSLKKSSNLVSSSFWYPKDVMLKFIDYDEVRVRKMFKDLFDENVDVEKRAETFVYHCDMLRDEIAKTDTSIKNHFHDGHRMISLYLAFRYPEKYAIYKYTEFKKFMQLVDATDIPTTKETKRFYKIVKTIYNILKNDDELLEIHKNLLDDECYKGETLMLAQDFIFCSARRYM